MEIPVLRHRFLSLVMTPPAACLLSDAVVAPLPTSTPSSIKSSEGRQRHVDRLTGPGRGGRRWEDSLWLQVSERRAAFTRRTALVWRTELVRQTRLVREDAPRCLTMLFGLFLSTTPTVSGAGSTLNRRLNRWRDIDPYRANVSELLKSPSVSEKAGNSSHYFLVVRCSDHVFSVELHLIGYHEYFL